MPLHPSPRRGVLAFGALAAATLLGFGLAAPAVADPIGDVGNIVDPDAGTGSIVVHKYVKDTTNGTDAGDGTELSVAPGEPLEDVEFTLYEILLDGSSIDLLDNAGWALVDDLANTYFDPSSALASITSPAADAAATAAGGTALTSATVGTPETTDSTGTATFAGLGYGLYLVVETDAPLNVTDAAQPFLVTVPFPTGATDPTNPNEWLYTVHTYPKNSTAGVSKKVLDTDAAFATAGDFATWSITANIPVLVSGATTFDSFDVEDTIDPTTLAIASSVPTDVSPTAVRVYNAAGTDITSSAAFASPADYTIPTSGTSSEVMTLTFTAAGLQKLFDSAQGGRVEFDVATQVVAVPAGGTITNDAILYVNGGQASTQASADFGALRIFKYADTESDPFTALAGATFELYADDIDLGGDGAGDSDPAELVTVDGVSEWTTDASGLIDIAALKPGAYLLVETAAPAGYQAVGAPIAITVVAGQVSTTVDAEQNYVMVENHQISPLLLPFTGSNGVVTFTLLGGGILALAFGLAVVGRRRKQQAQHA